MSSYFIYIPFTIKQFLFYFVSFITFRKRYSGNFSSNLNYFLKHNDVCQLSDSTDVIATKEIQLLYGFDDVRKISDFDIIDKQILKKMISDIDYYNKIAFKNSLATSGSTGNSLQVPVDSEFLKYKFASSYFFNFNIYIY